MIMEVFMRTDLQQLTFTTAKNEQIVVSKNDLAHAQAVFGNDNIGWPQCKAVNNGVEFFLDLCTLFKLEFVPVDISRDKSNYDSKNIYFDLCDAIKNAPLPVEDTRSFSEFINKPIEADVYNMYNNKDETPVDDPVKEVVITNVVVTEDKPVKTPVELLHEIVAEAENQLEEETTELTEDELLAQWYAEEEAQKTLEAAATNDTQELNNNLEEDSIMDQTNSNVTNEEMFTEQLNDFISEEEATVNMEDVATESGEKVKEAMGVINKYLTEFKNNAKDIMNKPDKEVYEYVMNRIDKNIEAFSGWMGIKYQVVADALIAQRDKMKKAKKDVEDAADDNGLDEESKESVIGKFMGFLGKIIKAVLAVTKSVIKFAFKLAGITLTLAFRIGKDIVTESIHAGKAVGVAFMDTVTEIKEEVAPGSNEDDFDDDFVDEEDPVTE